MEIAGTLSASTLVSDVVTAVRRVGASSSSREDSAEAASAPGKDDLTIDDLAAATGVPSRTIRFYQAKGALPPPVRKGRVAYYGPDHVERLRLVAQLQDKGLSLRAIRDLMQRTEGRDVSVAEWLGVGERLRAPWSDDRPRICTEAELAELGGGPLRPGLVSDLERAGLIRREGEAHPAAFVVPSTGLLQIALELGKAGVDLELAVSAHEILRRRMARAADELAELFVDAVRSGDGATPDEIDRELQALRTLGIDAVRLVFAQEVERALRSLVERGRALPPRRRR